MYDTLAFSFCSFVIFLRARARARVCVCVCSCIICACFFLYLINLIYYVRLEFTK